MLNWFSHSISEDIILKIFLQSKSSCITNTVITAEMTPKFNLSGLILKNFQQLERCIYIARKYKLSKMSEITLKFNLRGSNSQ